MTIQQIEARRAVWDKRFKKNMQSFFTSQGTRISKVLVGSNVEYGAAVASIIESDIPKLAKIYQKLYTDIVKDFGTSTYNELMSVKMFSIFSLGVYTWIASMALARAKKVSSYSKFTVLNIVKKANEEGWTIQQTAKVIKTLFMDSFSKKRSVRIARTEVSTASNYGSIMGAKQTGLKLKKFWIATSDARTRPTHKRAGKQPPIDIDARFRVGRGWLQYPGDQHGPAEEVVNCRCAIGYRRIKEV